jgi:hypothetical protein
MEEMTDEFSAESLFGEEPAETKETKEPAETKETKETKEPTEPTEKVEVSKTSEVAEEIVPDNPNVVESDADDMQTGFKATQFNDDIPNLVGKDIPEEYNEIYVAFRNQYALLPKLSYKEIYSELGDLNVECHPSPTMQAINDDIQKIQACKERLSEIFTDVQQNFYFKKRAVDVLEKAWAKYTDEKNAEKRKGDAAAKVSLFYEDFAQTEACFHVCQHILKNLDSHHDSLSKRIMVNGQLLKMNDYGRGGGIPERNYSPSYESDNKIEDNPDQENQEVKEEYF